jgi:hypothetical protein
MSEPSIDSPLDIVKKYETYTVNGSKIITRLPLKSTFEKAPIKIRKLFQKDQKEENTVGYCDIEYEFIGGKTIYGALEELLASNSLNDGEKEQIEKYKNLKNPNKLAINDNGSSISTSNDIKNLAKVTENSEELATNSSKEAAIKINGTDESEELTGNINNILLNNISKLRSIRCTKKTFYRGGYQPSDSIENLKAKKVYEEVFRYNNTEPTPDELRISKITDKNGKEIGYRYYDSSYRDIASKDNYFSILEDGRGRLAPFSREGDTAIANVTSSSSSSVSAKDGDSILQKQFEIVSDIFREKYKDKPGYEIHGDYRKSLAFLALSNSQGSHSVEVIAPGQDLYNKITKCKDMDGKSYETYFNNKSGKSKDKSLEDFCGCLSTDFKLDGNKKISLIPLILDEHATTLVCDRAEESKPSLSLVDSSGAHCNNYEENTIFDEIVGSTIIKKPREDLFDSLLSNNIKLYLGDSGLQANGTCQFWSDAFVKVISDPNNNYSSKELIDNGFRSGKILLQAAMEVGKIFDEEPPGAIVKKINANDEDKNYVTFNLETGEKFGINKKFATNRFVNVESLTEKIKTEENIKNFKEQFGDELEKRRIFREKEFGVSLFMKMKKKREDVDKIFEDLYIKKDSLEQTMASLKEKEKEYEKEIENHNSRIKAAEGFLKKYGASNSVTEKPMEDENMINSLQELKKKMNGQESIEDIRNYVKNNMNSEISNDKIREKIEEYKTIIRDYPNFQNKNLFFQSKTSRTAERKDLPIPQNNRQQGQLAMAEVGPQTKSEETNKMLGNSQRVQQLSLPSARTKKQQYIQNRVPESRVERFRGKKQKTSEQESERTFP